MPNEVLAVAQPSRTRHHHQYRERLSNALTPPLPWASGEGHFRTGTYGAFTIFARHWRTSSSGLDARTATSDAILAALITRTSRQICSYLQRRSILPRIVTESRDGTGGSTMVLREWPVISLTSLTIGNQTIPPRTSICAPGWVLEPWDGTPPGRAQTLSLSGYSFGCLLCLRDGRCAKHPKSSYQAGIIR